MPPAARFSDPTGHGPTLAPGPGSNDVLIGYMAAWRALPAAVAAAVDAISNSMNSFMQKPVLTPADAAADLAQISQNLIQGGAKAAAAGAPAAAGAAGSQVATLTATNVTLTTTWTTASAAPGGQPAANTAYTEGIKAAAATAASAVMSAMSGLADMHICPIPCPVPPHGPGFVTKGSGSVLINNLPACRQGDKVMEACGGADPISTGEQTVVIGDSGAGAGGGGGGGGGDGGAGGGGGGGGDEEDEDATPTAPTRAQAAQRAPPRSVERVGTGVHWISIELVDEANQPVAGEPFVLTLPPGERTHEIRNSLDARGMYKVEGLRQAGACEIRFPELDLAAWERWTPHPSPASTGAAGPPAATAEEGPVPRGPETPGRGQWHRCRQGECVSSLALDNGHFWNTIWSHSANAELKRRRGNPNVLLPGDWVHVPDKRPREESGNTDQHHKFLRRGERAKLRLRIMDGYEARANLPYRLTVDGQTYEGTTDADGRLECSIPGNARTGRLHVGDDAEDYILELGAVDPVSEVSGVQARLNNLGFDCGPVDGIWGPKTETALCAFQIAEGLEPTGEPDQASRAKLLEKHGS